MVNFVSPSKFSDLGVKPTSYGEYADEQQKKGLAEALAQAQIMQQQVAMQKAMQPDIEDLGKRAFMKAATGQPISPEEGAALQYLDSKSQNYSFNPVTGNLEQKPSLLQRAGVGSITPPSRSMSPTDARNMPITPEATSKLVQPYGDDSQPVKSPNPTLKTSNDAMQVELDSARGNPKLQQSIREKYTGAKTPDKIFAAENTLRDEFNTVTKDFRVVQDAYSKIKKTSNTGAGDMSMLYQYVKLLDPGSVVRESEFATAAASGSFGERIQGAVKGILEGGRLNQSLRAEFLNEANNVYAGQKQGYDRAKNTYKGLAERNQLNIQNVITDYAEPEQPALPPGATLYGTSKGKPVYKLPNGKFLMEQ